jgi:LPS sulfotransferase NodH
MRPVRWTGCCGGLGYENSYDEEVATTHGAYMIGRKMKRYTELEISSELLDQPEFHGTPKKIFICSTPRSGSYLLCRFMINAGLGVPHEYFNPIVIRQIAPRLGLEESMNGLKWWPRGRKDIVFLRAKQRAAEREFLRKYLPIVVSKRCRLGVFAAKIHFRDFRTVLDNQVGRRLLEGGVFVHLYREDLLKQAISERFAQLTGQWGIDGTVTTAPAADPIFFDLGAIDRTIKDLSVQDRGWRSWLARNSITPISISYEKLCEDTYSFVETIACRAGIDPQALQRGYSEAISLHESNPGIPSKAEVERRYLESHYGSKKHSQNILRLFGK